MNNSFVLGNGKVILNFSAEYCEKPIKIISSLGFREILNSFLNKIQSKNTEDYKFIQAALRPLSRKEILDLFIDSFKLLLNFSKDEIIKIDPKYSLILSDVNFNDEFIEGFYSFWRHLERYSILNIHKENGFGKVSFLKSNIAFEENILSLYRTIKENATGNVPNVYRQLPAGANIGLTLDKEKWSCPDEYEVLREIPFIESIVLDQPVIAYTKMNTRDGIFKEVFDNPVENIEMNKSDWFCYPAKVGELLAFIYFHRDFMIHGVSLCNLFEMATPKDIKYKKPDLIYVFGANDGDTQLKTVFYNDKENDIMVGFANNNPSLDYFGYMKKMILTLHNIVAIKNSFLPIHGAMVHIVTKEGKSSNVVIMGDSGAGKSESLEALRALSQDYISKMTVVFDDMGILKLDGDSKPLGYGTEIGAFVRLDDLAPGFAFEEIDRSIFMNPNRVNSRLIVPVANYREIIEGYPIDLFLYANNYQDVNGENKEIELFDDISQAIDVFKAGARMAKGTTTETGLVTSYFANPFGPVQRIDETDKLIQEYFDRFYKSGVKVGQIRTCLGIPSKASDGPKNAAIKLFELIKNQIS